MVTHGPLSIASASTRREETALDRSNEAKEALASARYAIKLFIVVSGVVAAVAGIFFLPTSLLVKFLIVGLIVLSVTLAASYEFGRRMGASSESKKLAEGTLPDIQVSRASRDEAHGASVNESPVIRTYNKSQQPDFFAHASQLAETAENIILIATGLNLLWNEHVADMLFERAISGKAKVTVCMGHHRNPHVLDRLIEEHMDESELIAGGNAPREYASFTRGADKVKALAERLERAGNPENFKLLLFTHYPTFATLIFDDQIFVYPYAYIVSGTDSPVLQIKDGTPEAQFVRKNAQRIAHDAIPARDVVQARRDQRYHSNQWKTAAVLAIPERDTHLYRAGSDVLGYDIWQGEEIPLSEKNDYIRKHVGDAGNSGFNLALTDPLLFGNQAMIERVRAELRWLAEQFPAVSLTAMSVTESLHDPQVAVLKASDESGTLEALHHELVSRVYGIAISSQFRTRRSSKQYSLYDARAKFMIQRYGAPNILSAFAPHFTLCSAMPADPAARNRILEELKSALGGSITENCSLTRIVLAVHDSGDDRWSVLDDFKLDG